MVHNRQIAKQTDGRMDGQTEKQKKRHRGGCPT